MASTLASTWPLSASTADGAAVAAGLAGSTTAAAWTGGRRAGGGAHGRPSGPPGGRGAAGQWVWGPLWPPPPPHPPPPHPPQPPWHHPRPPPGACGRRGGGRSPGWADHGRPSGPAGGGGGRRARGGGGGARGSGADGTTDPSQTILYSTVRTRTDRGAPLAPTRPLPRPTPPTDTRSPAARHGRRARWLSRRRPHVKCLV